MRVCAKCGVTMPMENRRGPRRKMCETCSPSRPRKVSDHPKSSPAKGATTVLAAVTHDLAGALHTTMGQTALALARRIDAGKDQGAGLASLAKRLQSVMAAAAPRPDQEMSPLQELRARDELAQRRDSNAS